MAKKTLFLLSGESKKRGYFTQSSATLAIAQHWRLLASHKLVALQAGVVEDCVK